MFSDSKMRFIGAAALLACLPPAGVLFSPTAVGQEFCSKPVVPYCVNPDAAFDTTLQVNSCRQGLDNYEEELADYEQCIADEIEAMRRQVADTREKLEEVEQDL